MGWRWTQENRRVPVLRGTATSTCTPGSDQNVTVHLEPSPSIRGRLYQGLFAGVVHSLVVRCTVTCPHHWPQASQMRQFQHCGCTRPRRARCHSPCRVDRNSLAVLKLTPADQLAQFNKAVRKAMADVTEFTILVDVE